MPTSLQPFAPAPSPDLGLPEVRGMLRTALERTRARLGAPVAAHIGGRDRTGPAGIRSWNPAHPTELIGTAPMATATDIDDALEAAWRAFPSWKATPDDERIALVLRVATLMRERAADLAALLVLETGKSWAEGTGEVAESIDFLEYHARQMLAVRERETTAVFRHPTEANRYRYLPLGAGALIPPWPFPLAQTTAMVSAAVVAGNTVVVKPASLAPVVARRTIDLWLDAGAPAGVVNLVFGPGHEVGHALVGHPRTRFVTLTGSKATGLAAHAAATSHHPQRPWFTRVALELGGKNPVVVDDTADLDAAASGIVAGAFSFQGQKCSAGSRAIVVRSVYEELVQRILGRVAELNIGDPTEFGVDYGPLIDASAVERVLHYLDVARREGRVVAGGGMAANGPLYVQPTVVTDVPASARIAREEILGPVLAVISAEDVHQALDIAGDSEYGLTGSFYARDTARLVLATERMQVGSLYLNRKPTASEVGFHPFGGFGMSGTDAKAGGPDYLLHYLQPQSVTRVP